MRIQARKWGCADFLISTRAKTCGFGLKHDEHGLCMNCLSLRRGIIPKISMDITVQLLQVFLSAYVKWTQIWVDVLNLTALSMACLLLWSTFLLRDTFILFQYSPRLSHWLLFSTKVIKHIYFYNSFLPVKSRLNECWIITAISCWLAAKSHVSVHLWGACVCVCVSSLLCIYCLMPFHHISVRLAGGAACRLIFTDLPLLFIPVKPQRCTISHPFGKKKKRRKTLKLKSKTGFITGQRPLWPRPLQHATSSQPH